jgi:SAM-dependent methyltransferase
MSYRESHVGQWTTYEHMYEKKYNIINRWLEREILKKIFLSAPSDPEVLDFACGTWRILEFLETYFDHITWLDVSPDMMAIARSKTKKAKFLKGDITDWYELPSTYDIITAFRFFLNAESQLRSDGLKAIIQYLNTDGIFIFNNHWNKHSLRTFKVFFKKIIWITTRNNTFSHQEILSLLHKNNLELVDVYPVSFISEEIYRIVPSSLLMWIEHKLQKISRIKLYAVNSIYVTKKK